MQHGLYYVAMTVKVFAAYREMLCKCTPIFRFHIWSTQKTGSTLGWASF